MFVLRLLSFILGRGWLHYAHYEKNFSNNKVFNSIFFLKTKLFWVETPLPVVVILSVLLADQSSCHEAEKTTTTEHYQHQDQPCSTTATALHKPDNLLWLSLGLRPASGIKTLHALNQSSGSAVEPGVAPLYKVATSPHSLPVDLASSIFNCPVHWLRNFPPKMSIKREYYFSKVLSPFL